MWHTESYNAIIKEVLDNSEHIPVTRKKDINKNWNSTETSFIGEGLVIRYIEQHRIRKEKIWPLPYLHIATLSQPFQL